MTPWRVTTLAVVALLGTACSQLGLEVSARDEESTAPADAVETPTPTQTREATRRPTTAPRTLVACDPEDVALMDSAVGDQLAAFAAGEYEEALEHATEGFRRQFPPEQFEELITESFPEVTLGGSHSSGACLTDGDNATLEVGLTDADGLPMVLVYLMERVGEAWRIAGAVPDDADPPQSASSSRGFVKLS